MLLKLGLKAGVVLLGMTLAGGAWAVDEQGPPVSDPVDFSLLLAPNLGAGSSEAGWYDDGTDDQADRRRPNRALVRLPANSDRWERSGLAIVDVSQVFYGDLSAEAAVELLSSSNHATHGSLDDPLLQVLATAVGNTSTVSTCMFSGCEDVVVQDEAGDELEEPKRAEGETVDLAALMAPSLGATVGSIDWDAGSGHATPVDAGLMLAHGRPLGPVRVQTSQILVGDVSSSATVNTAIASANPPVDLAEIVVDLPEVEIAATSVGNAASFDTDVDAHVEADQIVVGAVIDPAEFDAAIGQADVDDNSLSRTLLSLVADSSLEKSVITADASAHTLVNTLTDVRATSLANSYSIGDSAMSIDGVVFVDVDQFAYADISAFAHIDVVALTQSANVTAIASALGNVMSATSR